MHSIPVLASFLWFMLTPVAYFWSYRLNYVGVKPLCSLTETIKFQPVATFARIVVIIVAICTFYTSWENLKIYGMTIHEKQNGKFIYLFLFGFVGVMFPLIYVATSFKTWFRDELHIPIGVGFFFGRLIWMSSIVWILHPNSTPVRWVLACMFISELTFLHLAKKSGFRPSNREKNKIVILQITGNIIFDVFLLCT